MELSVKKRINKILENVNRIQELAGLSDPEAGYVAPPEAYEDDYQGLQKRFGNNILKKIELFVQNNLNQQLVLDKTEQENLFFKISPPIVANNQINNKINSNYIFVRFGGYMSDAKEYVFNVGYKDNMNQEIFVNRFVMDLKGNLINWQSTKF